MVSTASRQSIPSPKESYDFSWEVENQLGKILNMMAAKGWCDEAVKPMNRAGIRESEDKRIRIIALRMDHPSMPPQEIADRIGTTRRYVLFVLREARKSEGL